MVEPTDHLDVLATREILVDGGVLAGEPDAGAQRVGLAHDVKPRHLGVPGVGTQQGGQDSDGRGLARAVRPEHAEHGTVLSREVEPA